MKLEPATFFDKIVAGEVPVYKKSADQGNANAQCFLGVMYRQGRGVEQSDGEAVKLWRQAAEDGHASAQCYLGVMCRQGRGTEQSDPEAIKWYRKAAAQGEAKARQFLVVMELTSPEAFKEAKTRWPSLDKLVGLVTGRRNKSADDATHKPGKKGQSF